MTFEHVRSIRLDEREVLECFHQVPPAKVSPSLKIPKCAVIEGGAGYPLVNEGFANIFLNSKDPVQHERYCIGFKCPGENGESVNIDIERIRSDTGQEGVDSRCERNDEDQEK